MLRFLGGKQSQDSPTPGSSIIDAFFSKLGELWNWLWGDRLGNKVLIFGNPNTEAPLSPLIYAAEEAEAIAKLYKAEALLARQATESVMRSKAAQSVIVHLAAHGEYNERNPLFSTIYLAKDEQNKHDGRLEVHEVYGLNLVRSKLVVLSACETKIGDLSKGDEIVGLNRAFIYSGTPTVIASLWNVSDESTRLLMEQFYIYLRRGMDKAEALRRAQQVVREEYPHPKHWAAFSLTGDGGKLSNRHES